MTPRQQEMLACSYFSFRCGHSSTVLSLSRAADDSSSESPYLISEARLVLLRQKSDIVKFR